MGLYQQDFATRLAVTAQTVRNWEHGRAFPCRKPLKTLEILCDGVFDEGVGDRRQTPKTLTIGNCHFGIRVEKEDGSDEH
jgi:transcriptional regulator with XRE-family HTH domain